MVSKKKASNEDSVLELEQGRLKIPKSWIVAVVGALGTGGTAMGVEHYKLEEMVKQVAIIQAQRDADVQARHELQLSLQHIADGLNSVKDSLQNIDARLNEGTGQNASRRSRN